MMQRGAADAISVVLIEDQRVLADAIAAALGTVPGIRIVGTTDRLEEAPNLVRSSAPDVVLSDYRVGDADVADHLPALKEAAGDAAILVFTGWPDEASLLRAMDGGASGFIEKSVSLEELVDAIRRSADGEMVVSPRLLPLLMRRATRGGHAADLTRRELEVLALLAEGRSTQDIAEALFLSGNTVRNHVARLLRKLGARSRLEAVNVGVREGLIRLGPRRP